MWGALPTDANLRVLRFSRYAGSCSFIQDRYHFHGFTQNHSSLLIKNNLVSVNNACNLEMNELSALWVDNKDRKEIQMALETLATLKSVQGRLLIHAY